MLGRLHILRFVVGGFCVSIRLRLYGFGTPRTKRAGEFGCSGLYERTPEDYSVVAVIHVAKRQRKERVCTPLFIRAVVNSGTLFVVITAGGA